MAKARQSQGAHSSVSPELVQTEKSDTPLALLSTLSDHLLRGTIVDRAYGTHKNLPGMYLLIFAINIGSYLLCPSRKVSFTDRFIYQVYRYFAPPAETNRAIKKIKIVSSFSSSFILGGWISKQKPQSSPRFYISKYAPATLRVNQQRSAASGWGLSVELPTSLLFIELVSVTRVSSAVVPSCSPKT